MLTLMLGTGLRQTSRRSRLVVLGVAACAAVAGGSAWAHPHAWVKSKSDVIFKDGAIVALRHTWIFDAYYTQGATEGLDKNGDGTLDANELSELAKVNMDGLKEFGYFTETSVGERHLKFGTPTEASMEMTEVDAKDAPENGMMAVDDTNAADTKNKQSSGEATGKQKLLALTFTLPFTKPIPAPVKRFTFTVRDPSIFIWFELAAKSPVRLIHAPAGCSHTLGQPEMTPEQKRLETAFGRGDSLLAMPAPPNTVRLSCN